MISKVSVIKLQSLIIFCSFHYHFNFLVGKYFEIDALLPALHETTQIDY